MNTKRKIRVLMLEGNRDFVVGRAVGIVGVLVGSDCSIETIMGPTEDMAALTFETSDDVYDRIRVVLKEHLGKPKIAAFIF